MEGNLDSDGMSVQSVKSGFNDIKCKVYLDTDAKDQQVKELTEFVNNKAPVVDTIKNPVQLEIKSMVRASML